MATYQLINLRIRSAEGARIAGQTSGNEFFQAAAQNPFDRLEPTHNVTVFDKEVVDYYKKLLPEDRGGLLANDESWTEGKIKPQDRILMNAFDMEYDLGADYCQLYSNDIVDAEGTPIPGKRKGDVICDANGRPKVYRKILVFVRQQIKRVPVFDEYGMPQFDAEGRPLSKPLYNKETGELVVEGWVKGWSPEEVGEGRRRLLISKEAAMRKMNRPIEETGETVEQVEERKEAPNIDDDDANDDTMDA